MAVNFKFSLLTITIVVNILVYCNASAIKFDVDLEKVPSNAVACPAAEDIAPCTCKVGEGDVMDMDCSKVTSDAELASIFSKTFPSNTFRELFIEFNREITTLTADSLGAATFTKIAITSCTQLKTIEENAFMASAATLEKLVLLKNDLSSFPFEEMSQYTKLNWLELSVNSITGWPALSSDTLANLILFRNPIGNIPVDAFQTLPNIEQFNCFDCSITEVEAGTFTRSPKLQKLVLGYNGLTSLPVGAIKLHGHGPTTSNLGITNNQIISFPEGAVEGIQGILGIDFNRVTSLSEEVWRPILENLFQFSLLNNPLACVCDVMWLIDSPELLAKIKGNPRCAGGKRLKNLDPAVFHAMCQ
uniref:Oplophorus-luciferin 2-monooxygenase non-catalytic subunit n=1 Tax=Oplophorus gracilirostris TaxID=727944 RepID=LUCB_OPLGR|nr:RecName: Full=Oplophorus-luciferin 2-monooxygenase non-catalytic subunit; Flags: Precursor [Oplophorus gracilirostris]BAB13775.1 oxygenase [Oplophorus gracilirostris]